MAVPAAAAGAAAKWAARQAAAEALDESFLLKLFHLLLFLIGVTLLLLVIVIGTLLLWQANTAEGEWNYPRGSGIPEVYWPMYTAAAEQYQVNPYLLAAIHSTESDFSRSKLPGVRSGWNSCKAAGPMQFGVVGVPPYNAPAGGCSASGTWRAYADAMLPIAGMRPLSYPLDRNKLAGCRRVAGTVGCVYDDFDAIAAAAKLLHANGATTDLGDAGTRNAILAYNHSQDYVDTVLGKARRWQDMGLAAIDLPVGDTAPRTIERVIAVANAIDKATEEGRIPYCFGGGHAGRPGPSGGSYCWTSSRHFGSDRKQFGSTRKGLDCSGAVRWLLVQSGFKDPGGIASGSYGSYLRSKPGRQLTFYYRSGGESGHIWVKIGSRTWQTSATNLNHGPGWTGSRSTAGFRVGHLAGL